MSNLSNVTPLPPAPPSLVTKKILPRATTLERCNIDECVWADSFPDLQKACYLNKVCTYSPPKSCRFKNIPGILQEGPTCGLTALSMLLGGYPAALDLLTIAKKRNYTNNGEMFSAKNLYKLIYDTIEEVTADNSPQIECQMYEGQLNCAKVRDCLLDGACIFVAYPF